MTSRVAAHHADWLTLAEPTGPYLTLPVLREVWPDGLDKTPAELRSELRVRLAELDKGDPASRTAWVEWVLCELLGYGPRLASGPAIPPTIAHVTGEGAVARPDYALVEPDGTVRMAVMVHPGGQALDARVPGEQSPATPIERAASLCRATGVALALVTNLEHWTMVWAPPELARGQATFPASLWSEEPALLDAFRTTLGAPRFFAVGAERTIEALLHRSASAQAEVTDQLGRQARQAVELLVGAFSRANLDAGGALLPEPAVVYEAAVTVLMRLVFLLYAEERRLLRLGDDLYDRAYAASTMLEGLQVDADVAGDEPLERSTAAWHRLLATFRVVHAGIGHDQLRIPAYGGSLFDPDRFAFLEGRPQGGSWPDRAGAAGGGEPLAVDDLTVLAVLRALQELTFRQGGVTEKRRLTYRTLDVEQIGNVYEGLLDHSAVVADEPSVGLIGKEGLEPEVAVAEVESAAVRGRHHLVAWLAERTRRTPAQLTKLLDAPVDADTARQLRAAVDNDADLLERLTPYAHLLRSDLRGLPVVYLAGAVYVTETGAKRDSGTAYTTPALADELVRYTLQPLVYSPGPAEGAEPALANLRPSAEILALRVCDPAVGSGAILVAACRYLGERLVEAWTAEGKVMVAGRTRSLGDPVEIAEDWRIAARRAVAEQCLYGVDRNPMAVEMAKLSLWLVTMGKDRPFTSSTTPSRPATACWA